MALCWSVGELVGGGHSRGLPAVSWFGNPRCRLMCFWFKDLFALPRSAKWGIAEKLHVVMTHSIYCYNSIIFNFRDC